MMRHIAPICAMTWLIGCATAPPDATTIPIEDAKHQNHLAKLTHIEHFDLKGRLSIHTQKQGFSATIIWQHQLSTDNIAVFSPFGSKVAEIQKNIQEVIFTDAQGKSIRAQDTGILTEQAMGWRLPLSGLSDWILGKPTQGKIDQMLWDVDGKLTRLKQQGWDIEYLNYQKVDDYQLPSKIFMRSDQLNLKLLIEQWGALE